MPLFKDIYLEICCNQLADFVTVLRFTLLKFLMFCNKLMIIFKVIYEMFMRNIAVCIL